MLTTVRRQLSRVHALVCRRRVDQEFADELAAHLAMAVDDYVKRGLTDEQARRAAVLRLGNRASLMEQQRELQRLPFVETAWRDLHLTVRMLRRAPVFAATTILTLALGIAANTATFSICSALLIEPLPYPDADRLVVIHERDLKDGDTGRDSGGLRRLATAHARVCASGGALSVSALQPDDRR